MKACCDAIKTNYQRKLTKNEVNKVKFLTFKHIYTIAQLNLKIKIKEFSEFTYRLHKFESNSFIETTDTIIDAPFTIVVTM